MWDTLKKPWQLCLELAWESYCEGSVPIGAVIVDADGQIISKGRNLASASIGSSRNQIVGGPLAHAEINALLALDWSKVDVNALHLFTSVEPCPLCMGAICMAGLKRVSYAARDAWSGSTNLIDASPYFRWKQIEAIPPQNPVLETLIQMLQVESRLTRQHLRVEEVLRKWSEFYPENVRKGRLLHEAGELQRMHSQDVTAMEVFNRIAELSHKFEL